MTTKPESTDSGAFRPGTFVKHRKGGIYRVEGVGKIEATMTDAYAYRGRNGQLWFRPCTEMEDGRFTPVESDPQGIRAMVLGDESESAGDQAVEPFCYVRTRNGAPDWAEDCVYKQRNHADFSGFDHPDEYGLLPLYTRAQDAAASTIDSSSAYTKSIDAQDAAGKGVEDGFDFAAHLHRQREWSAKTFGPGMRSKGVVDHIRKELAEIEASPTDPSEWIDVVILALDGLWRIGLTPQNIITALVEKQTRNESRAWPDWRTAPADKAIEHDRTKDAAKPAQVGQKYRPVTLEDAEAMDIKLARLVTEEQDDDWPTVRNLLAALQSIGAVVPAQDGGV